MRSKHALLMAMGIAGMMAAQGMPPMRDEDTPGAPERDISPERHKANLKKKGVQDWTIDGITVQARDEKNAIRKVNNIKKAKGFK